MWARPSRSGQHLHARRIQHLAIPNPLPASLTCDHALPPSRPTSLHPALLREKDGSGAPAVFGVVSALTLVHI